MLLPCWTWPYFELDINTFWVELSSLTFRWLTSFTEFITNATLKTLTDPTFYRNLLICNSVMGLVEDQSFPLHLLLIFLYRLRWHLVCHIEILMNMGCALSWYEIGYNCDHSQLSFGFMILFGYQNSISCFIKLQNW